MKKLLIAGLMLYTWTDKTTGKVVDENTPNRNVIHPITTILNALRREMAACLVNFY